MAVRYAHALVNVPIVLKVLGWLLMMEGVFMLAPMGVCMAYGESDWQAFALGAAVCVIVGLTATTLIHPHRRDMGKREGFLLTALIWVVFSAFSMIPFMTCSTPISVSDAFFESMSGFTTTGATVMSGIEHLSHGVLFWRCMMQWLGGMGIILFTLAVIPMLNHSGGIQMFNAEVTGITHEKVRPRISQTAKSLWGLYIVLSLLCCMLLWCGPMDLFDSVCQAFSTISTGGFSTRNHGIMAWDSVYVKVIITIFMFLGGVSFGLMYKAVFQGPGVLRRNEPFRAYVLVIVVTLVIFIAAILIGHTGRGWEDYCVNPLFMIVSTLTSTGYAVVDFETWGTFVLAVIFVLMFCGGCAGSTAGGAKIDRMLFLVKNINNETHRVIHSSTIRSVNIGGKVISPDIVNKVIAFLCIYVLLVLFGGIVLTAFGIPLVDAFFSAFSCVGNTGLGAGVTGYGSNYDVLPDVTKWILSLLMLFGRLEIYTVLVLCTRAFWRR